jgi:hypothetical protein
VVNPRYSGLETKKLWKASALPSKIDKLSGLTTSCTDSLLKKAQDIVDSEKIFEDLSGEIARKH